MSYEHLPWQERMDMASDYALLVMDDQLTEDQIIRELAMQFQLSHQDAVLAYATTRTKHAGQFRQQQNRSIWKGLGAVIICLAIALFYSVAGEEVGWPFHLLAGFFLLASFGAIVGTVERLMERLFFTPGIIQERLQHSRRTGRVQKDWSMRLFSGALFFTFFTGIFFIKNVGIEDLNKTYTLQRFVLAQPVRVANDGNDYMFLFKGYPHSFCLDGNYLNFANYTFSPDLLHPGDTVGIQVRIDDYLNHLQFVRHHQAAKIHLLNVIVGAKPLVNWDARNKAHRTKNVLPFYILSCATALSLVILIIRHKLAAFHSSHVQ